MSLDGCGDRGYGWVSMMSRENCWIVVVNSGST